MTAPSLLDELEGVVRLMEAATPGEWFSQVSDPAEGVDCFWLMSLQASKALTEEVGSVNGSQWDDTQRANAELIARAVNFIRTHHAEIADMAKRLEAAERDASPGRCKACGRATRAVCDGLDGNGLGCTNAPPIDLAAVREVIESHINEAKKLRHDPESQDYLYEQADKLEAAIQEGEG